MLHTNSVSESKHLHWSVNKWNFLVILHRLNHILCHSSMCVPSKLFRLHFANILSALFYSIVACSRIMNDDLSPQASQSCTFLRLIHSISIGNRTNKIRKTYSWTVLALVLRVTQVKNVYGIKAVAKYWNRNKYRFWCFHFSGHRFIFVNSSGFCREKQG